MKTRSDTTILKCNGSPGKLGTFFAGLKPEHFKVAFKDFKELKTF